MIRRTLIALILVLLAMVSFATTALAVSEEDKKEFMKLSEQERTFLLLYF